MNEPKKRIFETNEPQKVIFSFDSPMDCFSHYRDSEGKRRKEFVYSCTEGPPIYADAKLHEAISKIKPQKGDPVLICKKQGKSDKTGFTYNIWEVTRLGRNSAPGSVSPGGQAGPVNGKDTVPTPRRAAAPGGQSRAGESLPGSLPTQPAEKGNGAPLSNGQPRNAPKVTVEERIKKTKEFLAESRAWANKTALDAAKEFTEYAESIELRNGTASGVVHLSEGSIAAMSTSFFIALTNKFL